MVNTTDFKHAMSHLTSAVSIVTTKSAAGQFGLTASAVCSLSDSPPSLLVCINQSSQSHLHFSANQTLAVNVLGENDSTLANVFASKLDSHTRFSHAEWDELITGSPILKQALVSFDCRVAQTQHYGTHTIFICDIVAIQHPSSANSLAYFNRRYHSVWVIGERKF